jgi:hypothetical protein
LNAARDFGPKPQLFWTIVWSMGEMAMQISVTDAKAQLTDLVRRPEAELDAQNC